jgi:hypothetical protein
MRIDRRSLIKAGAMAGAAGALPAAARIAPSSSLVVHDSRIAESRVFANGQGAGIDLARGWEGVRAHSGAARIDGLTGWSDYIALRGLFAAKGLRVVREERVAAPISGKAHLFRWSMMAR